MSEWIASAYLVISFACWFQLLGLVKSGEDVVSIALDSLGTIGSSKLSDDEKEFKLQRNSIKLFGLFFLLACGGVVSISLPLGVLWLFDRIGWLSLSSTLETTVSPLFLLASSLVSLLILNLRSHHSPSSEVQANSYSELDKILHRIAFRTYTAQIALANIEDRIFSRELFYYQTDKPVFITALPRAGTTLLLECLADLPEFATHCYRDMPFVLTPCLWNCYSRAFQKHTKFQERAHGDGMQISADSPEAFEEIIWANFWQPHYQEDRIIPWNTEENAEFNRFFDSHMRKIILLRHKKLCNYVRYLSKNNGNIARTRILKTLFPDAVIIIPFRDPLHHAASLLQQHLNFLHIHETDIFASEYMKSIGHYDFGQNFCPIDFDGWLEKRQSVDAQSLEFWLEYWVASYQHLLKQNEHPLNFLNYDALCIDPVNGLKAVAEVIEINDSEALITYANRICSPRPRQIDTSSLSKSLLQDVNSVYDCLKQTSVNFLQ